MPVAEGRKQLDTNLIGIARPVQLCLPTMRPQGSGRIVNISSIGGRFALPLGGWYHVSKFTSEGADTVAARRSADDLGHPHRDAAHPRRFGGRPHDLPPGSGAPIPGPAA